MANHGDGNTVQGGWIPPDGVGLPPLETLPPGLFTLDGATWTLSRHPHGWRVIIDGVHVANAADLATAETKLRELRQAE